MSITVEGLRKAYPIITEDAFTLDRIEHFLALGKFKCRPEVWGGLRTSGVYAYAAHKLLLEKQMGEDAEEGAGTYGRGALTGESDSVDGVSHSESYASSSDGDETSMWDPRPGNDYEEMARMVGISRGMAYVE